MANAVLRPAQDSFAGGEFSPDLYARISLEKYKTGLRTCRNFIIKPHGDASNRGGFRFIKSTKYSNKPAYMRKFIFSRTQAYTLEFGDYYIRFYTSRAQIQMSSAPAWVGSSHSYVVGDFVTSSAVQYYCIVAHSSGTFATDLAAGKWVAQNIYEVPTPYAVADVPNLRFEQSADTLYIFHNSYQQQTLVRNGDSSWTMAAFIPTDGPFLNENIDISSTLASTGLTGTVTLNAAKSIFNVNQVGGLWKLSHYIPGQDFSGAYSGTGTSTSISCFTTWRIISHGTWTGAFQIEKSIDNGSTWTMLRKFSSTNDFNANTFGTEDPTIDTVPFLIRINVTALSSGTLNVDLSSDPFYQDGIVRITAYTSVTQVTATVLQEIGLTSSTWTWSEGAWSNYRGYPGHGRFHQDRLCQSGSTHDPDTNWLSRSGNYTSYGVFNPVQDSDAIDIPLPSRQLNSINGLISFAQLICFTSGGSWTVQSTSGNTLTPMSSYQQPEEYYGSEGIEPVVIGREVIYVLTHGKQIRNISFNLYYNGFLGSEVSILSRHLFANKKVVDMAYQQFPDSVVWMLMDDGSLVGLTYLREQEVVAFHRHDTNGTILSITCIPGADYDEIWITVQRQNGIFVELLEQRLDTDPLNAFFVDSGLSYSGAPATVFTGLNHLIGQTVSILADGFVEPPQVVANDGSITLSESSSVVQVGLQYLSDLETLNVEVANQLGTIQGNLVKIPNATFRLVNSRGGWVGPAELDEEGNSYLHEDFIPQRSDLTPPPLFTGDYRVEIGGGFEAGGRVFYRQYDPLPVTIGAIFHELETGGLAP